MSSKYFHKLSSELLILVHNWIMFLLYVLATIVSVQALWSEFEFVAIENSKNGIVITDLEITRSSETAYAISGTVDVTADLNDDYDFEMKAYISAKSNGEYTPLPFKIHRDACCKVLESPTWKSLENDLHDSSDAPKRNGSEKYCFALKKHEYTIRQLKFNYNIIPKLVDTGTYKFVFHIYKKGSSDISSIATFVCKLY